MPAWGVVALVVGAVVATAIIAVWLTLRKREADKQAALTAAAEASTDDTEGDLRDARAIPDAVRRIRAIDAAYVELVKRRDPPNGKQ